MPDDKTDPRGCLLIVGLILLSIGVGAVFGWQGAFIALGVILLVGAFSNGGLW